MELLEKLIVAARGRGLMGVVVWKLPGNGPSYVAGCTGKDGRVCDPRSWGEHETPEGALKDLARYLPEAA